MWLGVGQVEHMTAIHRVRHLMVAAQQHLMPTGETVGRIRVVAVAVLLVVQERPGLEGTADRG